MITPTSPLLAVGNETTLQCQFYRQQIHLQPAAHVVFHSPAWDNATGVEYAIRQNRRAVQVCLFSQALADSNALQIDSNDCPFFLAASASYHLYLSARSMPALAPELDWQHLAIQAGYVLVPCILHVTAADHLAPSVTLYRTGKCDQMYTQQTTHSSRKVQNAAGPGALVDERRAQGVSRPETALLAQIRMRQLDLRELRYRPDLQTISLLLFTYLL